MIKTVTISCVHDDELGVYTVNLEANGNSVVDVIYMLEAAKASLFDKNHNEGANRIARDHFKRLSTPKEEEKV